MGIFEKYEVDAAGGNQNSGKRKNFASLEVDRGKAYDGATIGFEDYLTAKRNKQGAAGSFLKGFTHNFDDYAATINKAFGLKKGQEYWERQRKMNEVETQGHKLAHFGGEMLLDPVNLVPGGVFAEGAKAARVAKSAVSGAALGAGMTVAHDYGRSDVKESERNERVTTGAAMVGVLNGVIAAITKGKVRDAIKSPDDLASPEAKAAIDALANNPEAFGLKAHEAKGVVDEATRMADDKANTALSSEGKRIQPEHAPFSHPRLGELLDMRRGVSSKDTQYDKKLVTPRKIIPGIGKIETEVIPALYERNHNADFSMTKQDVDRIEKAMAEGKGFDDLPETTRRKLTDDLGVLENDPNWQTPLDAMPTGEDGAPIGANGRPIFFNPGYHLGMGAAGGTLNAFSGEYDPNRDLSTQIAEKFWEGMAAGMVGAQGLRMLRKRYPEAFEKIRNAVMENDLKPGDSVQLGMFAGQRAKGFKSAEEAGKVFPGKYDEMPRFEIDDSASTLKVPKTGAAYGTLDEVLDHPGLYENYPDLKDMDVRIDIDPTIQHGEARAHYQPYVDRGPEMFPITEELVVKARNRDEAHSALLHELQHAIQTREGFAGGANYEAQLRHVDGDIYNREVAASRSALDAHNAGKEIEAMKAKRNEDAFDRYRRHAGEIEARDVQARQGLTQEEREIIPPYSYPDETMWAEKLIDDPSYHAAKKAADEGRLLDKGAHGIDPEDAILDFSGSRADMFVGSKVDTGFRMSHKAPGPDEELPNSIGYNLSDVFPGIYTDKGYQYYRTGLSPEIDRASIEIIQRMNDNPDAEVLIYRAVPKDASADTIYSGDWVTINRDYAKEHGEYALDGDYKILSKMVRAGEIYNNGDSIHEWGYHPDSPIEPYAKGSFSDIASKKTMREIDDSGVTVRPISPNKAYRLDEVLNHSELFNHYPELSDIHVVMSKEGTYYDGDKLIRIGKGSRKGGQFYPDKATLLHEVQHAIQKLEGWQSGGDPYKVDKGTYERLWGEQQARATQYRAGMGMSERLKTDWTKTLKDTEGRFMEPITSDMGGNAYSIDPKTKSIDFDALEKHAEPAPEPVSLPTFMRQVADGVQTPIGKLTIDTDYLLNKSVERDGGNRIDYLHFVVPTLERPAYIIKHRGGFNFIKPFYDENDRVKKFLSVISDRDGHVKVVTAHRIENSKIRKIVKSGDIVVDNVRGATSAGRGSTGSRLDGANPESGYSIPQSITQDNQEVKRGLFDHDFEFLERLTKERDAKGWGDISQHNDPKQNIKNTLRELFTDTFSADYHAARDEAHGYLQQKSGEIERLAKVLSELDDETDKELYRYLTKTGGEGLDEKTRRIADGMRKTVDDLGRELVDAGLLDQKTYDEWVGAYLYRQYEPTRKPQQLLKKGLKLDRMFERGISKTFKPDDIQGMGKWLQEHGFLDEGDLAHIGKDPRTLLETLNAKGKTGLLREGKVRVDFLPDGKVKLRRDFTKSEREAMGEIESAKIAVPETLMRMQRLKAHAEFLKRAKGIDGVVLDEAKAKGLDREAIEKAGFVKLDGPQYGALSGKWVRRDVADDIGRAYKDITGTHRDAFKVWNSYHGLWKKSKTVWNPTAHMNNYLGNLFLMHLAGANSAKLPQILKEGADSMKALKRYEELELKRLKGGLSQEEAAQLSRIKKDAGYALEAKERGIFGKSQLNDILAGMEEGVVRRGALGKLDRFAEKMYQAEDNFNRLSFYVTLRKLGKDTDTAKKMVDYMLPDYSKPLPKGWRFMRDYGIAPFVSWSYYTMPSIVRMLGTKQGAKNAAKVAGLLGLMEWAATNGEVAPWDNLPFVQGNKPEDFKGRRFAYHKDGDKIDTIKMDRIIPYAELQNPVNYAVSQISGIVPNLIYTLNGMQMYSGRPVTYKNKSAEDKAIDWLKHLTGQYAPIPAPITTLAGTLDAKLRSKKRRRRNKTVLPRSTAQEVLKNIGINTLSYSERGAKKENGR